jgi:hypothetical protein
LKESDNICLGRLPANNARFISASEGAHKKEGEEEEEKKNKQKNVCCQSRHIIPVALHFAYLSLGSA